MSTPDTSNPAFAAVDLMTAELEITSSIYEGFSTAIVVRGQPRTVGLFREFADAVQWMATIWQNRRAHEHLIALARSIPAVRREGSPSQFLGASCAMMAAYDAARAYLDSRTDSPETVDRKETATENVLKADVARLTRREAELLEANNRYLERARRAEGAIKHLQESLFWRAGARLDHTMPLLKAEVVAQIREEADLEIEMGPDDEDPTTAHGLLLLCDWQDRAREARGRPQPAPEPEAEELRRHIAAVAAVVEETGGYWHACSGCHETEDGYPSQDYSHSRVFACQVGAGCSECGGLGAVWDDLSYVDDMVRDFLEEEKGNGRPSCAVADDVEMDCPVCAELLRPSDLCLSDIDLGICHAACLEGSPVVNLDTGEPLPADAPQPTPYRLGDI